MAKKIPEKRRFACGIIVNQLPPVGAILSKFDVDLEKGEFYYKPVPGNDDWNKNWAGGLAGYGYGTGYVSVKIDQIPYRAHRLIWKVAHGHDPRGVIDHINGVRDDNRLENLRDVMPVENARNAVDGRWSRELARRADVAKRDRQARIEARERELLARLKAKYEAAA